MFSEDLGEPAQGTLLGMGTLEAASYCADPAQRRQFVQVSVRVVRVPTLRAVVCSEPRRPGRWPLRAGDRPLNLHPRSREGK